ncbi:selenocysteine-specific translation elongation factor [Vallitalea sp.]|jgi:selenocysteine-specific elongation factor|uniref:selenocysteine-specific translation elongation factor n=1 Tax=Vallitalea sp. TaxID=1882829 RepID=UPI0025CF3A45|nr:selenocysteine-specific translation elongation factor [Vallitalea sp.]MCT4688966.1 selenocysteine-specific translation elongation factor [Vallitalea sp.]
MKHLIIGTAGHVDHGKTELVKALTGCDTDRLKEEKKRGMTIELGFAPLYLDEKIFSIVDVPGHEKLIKTMVSGATGMDMALLIIAADEGIMPQTIEHINILSMLDITNIIIVITKIDLMNNENLHNKITKIKAHIKETSLKDSPICQVSSKLNIGINNLKNIILNQSKTINKTRNDELFRMPIDRVFTIKGHGTVVTGTITGGKITKNDLIEILPDKINSKVRGIQVHGSEMNKAYAGQRCALNLTKVEKSSINRGDVIGKPEELSPTLSIDTVIYNLMDNYTIKHNQKVRIHIGTTEVMGKLKLIQQDHIEKNKKAYARIRLEKPVTAVFGDKFIIRSLTPVITIGGGRILSHKSPRLSHLQTQTLHYFTLLEQANSTNIILNLLQTNHQLFTVDKIFKALYINRQTIYQSLSNLLKQQKIIKLTNKYYISNKTYTYLKELIIESIKEYYQNNKYTISINNETLRTKTFPDWNKDQFDTLINLYKKNNILNITDDSIIINKQQRITQIYKNNQINKLEQQILKTHLQGFNITKTLQPSIRTNQLQNQLKFLQQINKIIKLNQTTYIHRANYDDLLHLINTLFTQYDKITVRQVRDTLQIGRKQTIILLEYLDQIGLTKRLNNYRIQLKTITLPIL